MVELVYYWNTDWRLFHWFSHWEQNLYYKWCFLMGAFGSVLKGTVPADFFFYQSDLHLNLWVYVLEIDQMSKFADLLMRIQLWIPEHELQISALHGCKDICKFSRYPRMWIFVTYLNNTSYCQMGTAFVTEPNINYWLQSAEDCKFVINLDKFQPH